MARELGIPVTCLYKWRDLDRKNQRQPSMEVRASERTELERLRRENARLREERDILKKAAMFFAEGSSSDSGSSK